MQSTWCLGLYWRSIFITTRHVQGMYSDASCWKSQNFFVYGTHTVHCTYVHVKCVCMCTSWKGKKLTLILYFAATTCLKLHVVDIPTSVLSCLLCSAYIRSVLELKVERMHILLSELSRQHSHSSVEGLICGTTLLCVHKHGVCVFVYVCVCECCVCVCVHASLNVKVCSLWVIVLSLCCVHVVYHRRTDRLWWLRSEC